MATMNPAAANGVPYRVPPEPSRVPSIVMALVVHAGLLGFLWAGISWQNTAPVSVDAEVWDMKVQQAAPQAPPEPVRPPPAPQPAPKVVEPEVERPVAPKPPDIALERIKEQKHKLLEKKLAEEKLLREKQKELADEKAKELADKKAKEKAGKLAKAAQEAAESRKLAKLREAEMNRVTSQAGGTGKDAASTAPRIDSGYINAILNKIDRNTTYNGDRDVPGNPRVEFEIRQLPTGEILSVKKIKSSGIAAFDAAVERGINDSSPLPKKKNGTVENPILIGIKMNKVDK